MAATKTDHAAAKQAKQKKILIGLSIVLVAVLAIQLPRIMGGSKSSTSAAPTADASATATGDATAAPVAATPDATVAAAQTAPAALSTDTAPKAGTAQLASFTLFESKDPFVQQIQDTGVPGSPGYGAAPAAAGGAAGGAIAKGDAAQGSGAKTVEKMTNATIAVNGDPQALTVEQEFPTDDPLFVLAGLKAKSARIGIAGGSLKSGKTVSLGLGDSITLVESATGARYTLKLLYVGTAPEQTAAFSNTPADASAGSNG